MFRNGQYLEVIKASNDCLATAVVTVQEKTVEIKSKKVTTNKWLQIEDWAEIYKILERAILRNGRSDKSRCESRKCEWKKSTKQLEIAYTFEPPECTNDIASLPTIKVHVSPARKKSKKRVMDNETSEEKKTKTDTKDTSKLIEEEKFSDQMTDTKDHQLKKTFVKSNQSSLKKLDDSYATAMEQNGLKRKKNRKYTLSNDLQNIPLEEYVPDTPKTKRPCLDFKYVPSNKNTLQNMEIISNEYTPTLSDNNHVIENVSYIPNSIDKLKTVYETYEPSAITLIPNDILAEYVPNSKGIKPSVEEYEPDFTFPSKQMKFDDSYVPSSVQQTDLKKSPEKFKNSKIQKLQAGVKKKMILFS